MKRLCMFFAICILFISLILHSNADPPPLIGLTVTISDELNGKTQTGEFDVLFTFSSDQNVDHPADLGTFIQLGVKPNITVTGGVSRFNPRDQSTFATWTLSITPNSNLEGNVTISVSNHHGTIQGGDPPQDRSRFSLTGTSSAYTVPVDTRPPTVESITGVPTAATNAAFDVTITFSEAVNGFAKEDISVTGPASVSSTSGSDEDTTYTATITPNTGEVDGGVTLQVSASSVTDLAGNSNTASAVTPSVRVDTTVPTVSISSVPTAAKNAAFDVTITFSEAVNGFAKEDISVTGPASVSSTSGSNGDTTYTATITPDTGEVDGGVTLQVDAGAVTDPVGNSNTASAVTAAVRVDTTAPTVEITDLPTAATNAAFDVTIKFSEAVNGFAKEDISVTGPASVSSTSGNNGGTIYTATITPNTGEVDGGVTLQVGADTVTDLVSNSNTASAVTTAVRVDTIVPTVSISGVPTAAKNAAFDVTIKFSEAVNGFAAEDITVTGPASASLKSGRDGDLKYVATITPDADADADVTLQVGANSVTDLAGNSNTASLVTPSVRMDTTIPTVEITGVPAGWTNAAFDITVTFSEAVNGFAADDISVTGPASVSSTSGSDRDTTYTATITPDTGGVEGDVTLQIPADSVMDLAGNANTVSNKPIAHIDTIPPTVQSITPPETEQLEEFEVEIVFSEEVFKFALEDIVYEGDAAVEEPDEESDWSGSGDTWTLTVTPHEDADGEVIIKVADESVEDRAGNANPTAATPISATVRVAPSWFPDANLRAIVRGTLNMAEGDELSQASLLGLSVLVGSYRQVERLKGLEHAEALTTLVLDGNAITDLEPLKDLTELTTLNLNDNNIQDIRPLTNLPYLTTLHLATNQIDDITPLEYSITLTTLDLRENLIIDLTPLTELSALDYLYLTTNQIDDVLPLASLGNLVTLRITDNPIRDVTPLVGLAETIEADVEVPSLIRDPELRAVIRDTLEIDDAKRLTIPVMQDLTTLELELKKISDLTGLEHATTLTFLNLGGNAISNIEPLTALTALTSLNLAGNAISDITALEELTELTFLNLGGNAISDITALEELTELTFLNLGGNAISDITALKELTELTELNLNDNLIDDLRPLARLIGLGTLELKKNAITDLGHLSQLRGLLTLDLSENDITDVSDLQTLVGLTALDLSSNAVNKLGGLSDLGQLTTLGLEDNAVTDVAPLASLTQLTNLNLNTNQVSDLTPVANLIDLTTLKLHDNTITLLNSLVSLEQLTVLDIQGNDISDVSPLRKLENLRVLQLARNPILDTTPLYNLSQEVPGLAIDIAVHAYPPWDVDEDGKVDTADVDIVTAALEQTGDSIANPRTDVNADGTVNNSDVALVKSHFDEEVVPAAPSASLDPSSGVGGPGVTRLLENYPNPFNPETWIPYELSKSSDVKISIYSSRGNLIRELRIGHQDAGVYSNKAHAAYWDGKNALGERVSSGVYFYTLTAGDFTATRKMLILK